MKINNPSNKLNKQCLQDLSKLCEISYLTQQDVNYMYFDKIMENKNKNKNDQCETDQNGMNQDKCVLKNCKVVPRLYSSDKDCQMYVCDYNEHLCIVFRGTESKRDVLTDINISLVELKLPNSNSGIKSYVHCGFWNQFNSIKNNLDIIIKDYYRQNKINFNTKILNDNNKDKYTKKTVIFTGHSLGGALSTIAALHYKYLYPDINFKCVTFGSPRVGCSNFKKLFNQYIECSYRFVNDNDPVPCIPTPWRFSHVKGCHWLSKDKVLYETSKWRFWYFCKNMCLSLFGYGYDAINDHSCSEYTKDLECLDC